MTFRELFPAPPLGFAVPITPQLPKESSSIMAGISASEFSMWRAVLAFALADRSLSLEEQEMLRIYMSQVPFSPSQRGVLRNDFTQPQDVETLFSQIDNPQHRERFCMLVRALVWCGGDISRQEQAILRRVRALQAHEAATALRATRNHPYAQFYYREYEKAGLAGIFKTIPSVQIRV